MKRIQTAEMKGRKARRNNIILGVVLIALLVIAPIGYSLMNNDSGENNSKVNERGLDFYKVGGLWKTTIDEQIFGFQYLPSEVVGVSVEGFYDLSVYVNQPLYFVGVNEAAPEILNNLQRYILRYQEACLSESSCVGDLPLKGCDSNLIIYEAGNDTKVYKNESCVYLVGDAVMAADAFLYETLGI